MKDWVRLGLLRLCAVFSVRGKEANTQVDTPAGVTFHYVPLRNMIIPRRVFYLRSLPFELFQCPGCPQTAAND
jgi:hypothetical protein